MNNVRKLYKISFDLPCFLDFHGQEIGTERATKFVLAKDKLEAYQLINKRHGYRPNKKCILVSQTESKCID